MADPEMNNSESEQATWNSTHLNQAESLIQQAAGHIESMHPQNNIQDVSKKDALEGVKEFQTTDLFMLREAYE